MMQTCRSMTQLQSTKQWEPQVQQEVKNAKGVPHLGVPVHQTPQRRCFWITAGFAWVGVWALAVSFKGTGRKVSEFERRCVCVVCVCVFVYLF